MGSDGRFVPSGTRNDQGLRGCIRVVEPARGQRLSGSPYPLDRIAAGLPYLSDDENALAAVVVIDTLTGDL